MDDDPCLDEFYDAMDSFSISFRNKNINNQLQSKKDREQDQIKKIAQSHSPTPIENPPSDMQSGHSKQLMTSDKVDIDANMNNIRVPIIVEPISHNTSISSNEKITKTRKFSKFLTKLKCAVSRSGAKNSAKDEKMSINTTNSSSMTVDPSSTTSIFSIFKRKDKNAFFQPSGYVKVIPYKKQTVDFDRLLFVQDISYRELRHQTDPFLSIPPTLLASSEAIEDKLVQRTIWTVKFSHNGRYLAAAGQQGILWIWTIEPQFSPICPQDLQNNDTLSSDKYFTLCRNVVEFTGHMSDIVELSWSKNQFVLTCSLDKTCRLWHPTRKECLAIFQHPAIVTSVAFHPTDDRFFISSALDCSIKLWNIPEKLCIISRVIPDTTITAVSFAQGGKMVMSGTFSGKCYFYDTDGLKYNTQLQIRKRSGTAKQVKITGLSVIALDAANIDNDEKILVTANDSKVRIYRLRDKSLIAVFKGSVNLTSQIKAHIGDDLHYIISASENGRVVIWKNFFEEERLHSDSTKYFGPGQKMRTLISAALHKDKSRQFEYFSLGSSTSTNPASSGIHPNEQNRMTCAIFAPISVSQQAEACLIQHEISSQIIPRIIVCADVKGHLLMFINHPSIPNRMTVKQDNNFE